MKKFLFSFLFLLLSLPLLAEERVVVISDPCIHNPLSTLPIGEGGRLQACSRDLFEQALDFAYQAKPNLIVVQGSITSDANKGIHEHVAGLLGQMEEAGIPVLVVPGEKDLAEGVDFASLYSRFGYAGDTDLENHVVSGLSWAGSLKGSGWGFVALAAEDEASLGWMKSQVQSLKQQKKKVIVLTRLPVLPHYEGQTTLSEAVKTALKSVASDAVLAGAGWVQNTQTAEGLTELTTGSLTVYPCWIQTLTLGNSLSATATMAQMPVEQNNATYSVQELADDQLTALPKAAQTAIVTSISESDYELYDGTPMVEYTRDGRTFHSLTYSRTFSNRQWQALYVPFEWTYNDWKDCLDVAVPSDVDEEGNIVFTEENTSVPAHTIALVALKSGKPLGRYRIGVSSRTLCENPEEEGTADVENYTLCGTYQGLTGQAMWEEQAYALQSGYLRQVAENQSPNLYLKPMRWYLMVKGTSQVPQFGVVVRESSATGVNQIVPAAETDQNFYNLLGQPVVHPRRGQMFISGNGKRIIE